MSSEHTEPRAPVDKYGLSRIEAFSDGVIAVAITLLILDLRVPEPEEAVSLAARLAEMWPNYLAYVISFLAIGILWINHHAALRRLKSADDSVVIINLLLLLCIVTVPFSTSLFATYLTEPEGGHLAAVVYAGSFLVTSSMFFALQQLILIRRPQLLRKPLTGARRRSLLLRSVVVLPVYVLAGALGIVTPYLTLAVCIPVGFFYMLPLWPSDRRETPPPEAPPKSHSTEA